MIENRGCQQHPLFCIQIMKRSFFILLLAMFCIGGVSAQTSYTIKGKITKTHLKRVFLQVYTAKDSVIRSEARIEPDGSFVFKGSLIEPTLAEVRLASTSRGFFFYLENNEINLSVDANDVNNTRITGSYSNSQYRYILEQCAEKEDSINECLDSYIRQNPESIYSPRILATQPCFALITYRELRSYLSKFTGAARRTYDYRILQSKLRQMNNVAVGTKLSDWLLQDTSCRDITMYQQLEGNKYLVINFWSAKGLTPSDRNTMIDTYRKYESRGVEFFSISFDVHRSQWIDAVNESGFTWKHGCDYNSWESVITKNLCISFIPCNIIIDSDGTIVARDISIRQLDSTLDKLLNK